jgi:hypothetical protein
MSEPRHTYDLYGDDAKRNPHKTFEAMRRDAPVQQPVGLDGQTAKRVAYLRPW